MQKAECYSQPGLRKTQSTLTKPLENAKGGMLLATWPPENPINLTRCWCLYEIHKALTTKGTQITVIMSPSTIQQFRRAMWQGAELSFKKMDSKKAEAYLEKDKTMIHKLISEEIIDGHAGLDAEVGKAIAEKLGLLARDVQTMFCRTEGCEDTEDRTNPHSEDCRRVLWKVEAFIESLDSNLKMMKRRRKRSASGSNKKYVLK